MMSTLAWLRAGLLIAAASSATAAAQITIAVGADEQSAWNDSVTFDAGVTKAWGHAGAGLGSASGHIGTGTPLCGLGFDCGPVGLLPGASGTARADATNMNLGVRAYAASSFLTQGFGEASVRDSLALIPGTLTLDIHLDLGLSASVDGNATYTYGIAFGTGDARRTAFSFLAREENGVRSAEVYLDDGATVLDLGTIPDTYDYLLNFPVFASGNVPIEVFASAVADSGSNEFASVLAFNSAWLGLTGNYTSLNGYGYSGFAAPIPEPTSAAVLIAGLALLGFRCRRGAASQLLAIART